MSTSSSNQQPDTADTSNAAAPGSDEDRAARAALTWLAEPGSHIVWTLVQQHGAPATLEHLIRGDIPETTLKDSVRAKTDRVDPRRMAAGALRQAQRLGVRIVVPSDAEWPTGLNALGTVELDVPSRVNQNARPPLCLWVRGALPLNETLDRSVAVVGARAATGYGTTVATDIAYGLAERGWTTVAGGAFGIEAAAHRATLTAGGRTVAVLACGVDRPYPAGNTAMFERITETGLMISEWPLGAEPLKHRFLARNRLIAAATAGTVVVEAIPRSDAVQMMGPVLALRRVAMVVPGPVTSAMSVVVLYVSSSARCRSHRAPRSARASPCR
jgi:DNA processing protein